MLQEIDGQMVYVVEFDEVPKLPITWDPDKPEEERYAQALAMAIQHAVITEGGKYAIRVRSEKDPFYTSNDKERALFVNFKANEEDKKYTIYKVIE